MVQLCAKGGSVVGRSDSALNSCISADSVFTAIPFIEEADFGCPAETAKESSGAAGLAGWAGDVRSASGQPLACDCPVELAIHAALERIRGLRLNDSLFIKPDQTVFDFLLGREGAAGLRPEQWQAAVGRRLLTAEEEAARARYFDRKCATGIARAKNLAGAA